MSKVVEFPKRTIGWKQDIYRITLRTGEMRKGLPYPQPEWLKDILRDKTKKIEGLPYAHGTSIGSILSRGWGREGVT